MSTEENVDGLTALQTPCFLIKSGTIIPKDWEVIEEAMFSFDGTNAKAIFENKDGKFPCLFYDGDNSMKAIVPSICLPEDLENRINKLLDAVGDSPETFDELGFDKLSWDSYINSKNTGRKPKI